MRTKAAGFLLAASSAALASAVHASETTTYKYDALGRLVDQSSTGTVNNGVKTQVCYDKAGNRITYGVVGVGTPAPPPPPCPPPPPPPPPPP
jgi:YD repeat-containing protein